MARAIVTAQVENSEEWEKGFRTHGGLFKDYSATGIHFATTGNNEVAILWELDNLDTFLALLESPETIAAMEFDGVKRDTVRIYPLDKEFEL